jgi:hypothetical protein
MKIEIKEFTDEMLPNAGKLLVARHSRHRKTQPLFPVRFEEAETAGKAVSAAWNRKSRNGYAAFRDGKMIAYLFGANISQPWGRCGYVYFPGYALAEGEQSAIIQDLYAKLGDDWTRLGVFSHGLYIAAADSDVIDALFNIGFGKERVDGLLDLRSLEIPTLDVPNGITIRRAGKGDNEHLGSLSSVIMTALANAPYWHPTIPEDWDELREGWSELADEKDWTIWLALEKDQAWERSVFTLKKRVIWPCLSPQNLHP